MQSKGTKLGLVVLLLLAAVFVAAFFHEPALTQAPVEQALDLHAAQTSQ